MNEDFIQPPIPISLPLPPLAVRLSSARIARGLTQTELAKRTELEPSAISHFETGRREPRIRNLVLIADALGVTTDSLLKGEKPYPAGETFERIANAFLQMKTVDRDAFARMAEMLVDAKANKPMIGCACDD